jgi:hypothetical protein
MWICLGIGGGIKILDHKIYLAVWFLPGMDGG